MPAAGGNAEAITKGFGYGPVAADGRFIYYVRSVGVPARRANEPGVWRVPLQGGEEERVVDQGSAGYVSVISDGICIFTYETQPDPTIKFYSFATGKWTTLLSIERTKAFGFGFRLSLSPDGQSLIYSRTDHMVNDLMLVENFR